MVHAGIISLLRDSEDKSFKKWYWDQYFIEIDRNATNLLSY